MFSSGPLFVIQQPVYDEIELMDPPTEEAQSLITDFHTEVMLNKCKQHNFKIPNPAVHVPSWLQQIRRQLHNVMVDSFFRIHKKRRAVNRLVEHREGLTFPPEYSSLKMPQLTPGSSKLGEDLQNFAVFTIQQAKEQILAKHIDTEMHFLNFYKMLMSKRIVAETYKSLAQTAYRSTFHADFTDWSSLEHILADHSIIHKLCSQEVGKRLQAEADKRQAIQAAQALAVQQESTMTVKELVTKTVQLQINKIKGQKSQKQVNSTPVPKSEPSTSSPDNANKPKGKKKKKGKPKKPKSDDSSNSAQQPKQNTGKTPKAKKAKKQKGQGKESQPMGSSSTSSRPQKGGKN